MVDTTACFAADAMQSIITHHHCLRRLRLRRIIAIQLVLP